MSVLIKGMEMPTNCQHCPCADDGSRYCKAANEYIPMLGKPKFCPLIEVPTPHGRLIDGDMLESCIYERLSNIDYQADAIDVLRIVQNAPTIEVEPVKRGKWEDVFCSVCGAEAITEWNETGGEHIFSPYCPNCGAKMEDKPRNNKRDTFSK